jgi:hypothetical protein
MVAVKLDGIQNWSWPVVFIPLFILVGLIFLLVVGAWVFSGPDDLDGETGEEDFNEEEAAEEAEQERIRRLNADAEGHVPGSESPAQERKRIKEEEKQRERSARKCAIGWARFKVLFIVSLAIAFTATVAVRLEASLFSWSAAFIPW